MAALMCIKRADAVLGTDHSRILTKAVRGFTGTRATRHQLPPYSANAGTGVPASEARGCGNSYMCLTSPELWPEQAKQWYQLYDRFFWQSRITAVGYREYPLDVPHSDWTMDVDAGPVIAGHGVSASAFGIGAARKNGRFDRAYPLAAEMLATVVELPNGMLAIPRLLSNFSDAPMLGEASILFFLTIQPQKGFPVKTGGSIPAYTYIILLGLFLFGAWRILESIWTFREMRREPEREGYAPKLQAAVWVCLMLGAVTAFVLGHAIIGIVLLVVAVMLPILKRKKKPKGTEGWPGEKTAGEADKLGKTETSGLSGDAASRKTVEGLTLVEVLLMVSVIILLIAPLLARGPHPKPTDCASNLKQIGIAFRTFALDNIEKFPMQISVTNEGTKELITSGLVSPHFGAISNELSAPKVLLCPQDTKREYAANFTTDFGDGNISYFVNVDASKESPSAILCGDRNLVINSRPAKGLVQLATNQTVSWSSQLHRKRGYILLVDGSVSEQTSPQLQATVQSAVNATNRLVVP
jgi:hypothetical protein